MSFSYSVGLTDSVIEQNIFHPFFFHHLETMNGKILLSFFLFLSGSFISFFPPWNTFFQGKKYRYCWLQLQFSRLNLDMILHLCLFIPKMILHFRLGSWLALLLFPAWSLKVSLILSKSTNSLYLAEKMRWFCVGKCQALLLFYGRAKRLTLWLAWVLKRLYFAK